MEKEGRQAIDQAKKAIKNMGGQGDLSFRDYQRLTRDFGGSAVVQACNELNIKISYS